MYFCQIVTWTRNNNNINTNGIDAQYTPTKEKVAYGIQCVLEST